MNVIYSPRAVRDLAEIAAYYRASAGERTIATFGQRIEFVIAHLAEHPHSAPLLAGRHNVRSAPILHYPYKVFYRVREDAIEILHIRHTARRPWPSR